MCRTTVSLDADAQFFSLHETETFRGSGTESRATELQTFNIANVEYL